jgi:conjugal transfer pilus assembly protein TraW
MCKKLSILLLALLPVLATAKDFGVNGQVWEIAEPDIREALVRSAAKVDWQEVNEGIAERAKSWADNLEPHELPLSNRTATTWVDPSIVLTGDIKAPFETETGYEWRVVYPSGTRVNPLEAVRPVDNMLFFDGRDPEQVKFALAALKKRPLDLILVLTAGNPEKLGEKVSRPVYYANPGLIDRFKITSVPSLLGVGTGDKQYMLAVTSLAKPYKPSVIDAAWTGLAGTTKPTKNKK